MASFWATSLKASTTPTIVIAVAIAWSIRLSHSCTLLFKIRLTEWDPIWLGMADGP